MSQLGTGKIVYNPKNRVPKKKELAIQRTYAQDAIQLIAENLSSLENQELATSILADFAANRHHYVVTPRPAHAEHLATLYRFLEQEPITNTFFNVVEAKMCKTTTPPWTAIVKCPEALSLRTLIQKPILNPAWGPHITWTRNEEPPYPQYWNAHADEGLVFNIVSDIKVTNHGYYFVDIVSQKLADYRYELGLNPRPRIPFHLTIGKTP